MNNINIKGLKINNTQEVDSILGSIVGSGESNAIPTTLAVYNLVSSEMSIEVSNRQIVDMSLSTALSSEISNRTSGVVSLSTAISTANSTRASADISLSTALSSEISTTNSEVTSLSTVVSDRISADVSLSTAINNKLSVSGGTVSSSFYLNGLLNNATPNYILYYNDSTSGITYGVKPTGTPGGSNTYVQFNDGGVLGGDNGFVYIKSTKDLVVSGLITGSNIETHVLSRTTKVGITSGYSENETAARYNTFLGYGCGYSNTTGFQNLFSGYYAGYSNLIGYSNLFLGGYCGYSTTGNENTFVGINSGRFVGAGSNNTFLGYSSGYSAGATVSNCVFLGYRSGIYETASNKLFIDSFDRTDEATARTQSLIYGVFNPTASNQELYLNSKLYVRHLTSSTQSNVLYYNITTKEITYGLPDGNGTVTSVAAGNGMNFSNITTSGTITLGTPSTITSGTTNLATTGTHTHQISGFLPLSGGVLTGTLSGTSLYLLNNIATNGDVITNGNTRGATLNGAIIRNGGYSLYFPPNSNGQSETLYKFPTTDDCVVLRFIVEGTIIRGEGKFGGFKIEGTASKSGASYYFITTPVVTTDFEVGLNVTSVSLQIIGSNIELSVSVSNYNYWTIVSATLYGNQISRTIIGTGQQVI